MRKEDRMINTAPLMGTFMPCALVVLKKELKASPEFSWKYHTENQN